MGFDYDKISRKKEGGHQWTAYSDLFMVLSVVFLLLYVVTSMRNGTFGIQKHVEYQTLHKENADLKQQLKVYDTLKEEHLKNGVSKQEKETYDNLMDKLSLLKKDAKNEKEDLRMKAFQNEKKEKALNKYQQVIRNIIQANLLAQARIKKRENIITNKEKIIDKKNTVIFEKDKTIVKHDNTIKLQKRNIASKEKEIKNQEQIIAKKKRIIANNKRIINHKQKEIKKLNKNIKVKKQTIVKNNNKIQRINSKLQIRVSQLKTAYNKNKVSKKNFNKKMAILKAKSKKDVQKLKKHNTKINSQLANVNSKLRTASKQIRNANKTIVTQEKDKKKLKKNVILAQQFFKQKILQNKKEFDSKVASIEQQKINERQEYLKNLDYEKKRQAKLKSEFAENVKAEKLKRKQDKANAAASINNLRKKTAYLTEDLKKARYRANTRKRLIGSIKKGLKKAGLNVNIDGKSGDVILSFKDDYFDTDNAILKQTMKKRLEKFFPTYSKSLLSDKKIAKNIASVEIVGFASPTFGGKYIDPKSLDAKDKLAVEYNMNLSFERAKSIFNYIFDTKRMKYQYQRNIRPLVKVTGRSFLADGIKGRSVASGMSRREYCKRYNCKKSQRVIIRFNLKD